ncbi:MAG: hypothetical protein MI740_14985 [Halanaerobiales bacterium]|nr:hypothetical protein [Halanaerobiales bacterium]
MKKSTLAVAILIFVTMISVCGQAMVMDRLLTVPTADLINSRALINGEIYSGSKRVVEGIFMTNSKLEIGGMVNFYNQRENELGIRAKTVLSGETKEEPAISAGIKNRDLYLVVSKNLGRGFRGHLGLGNGDFAGLFIGINKILNPVSVEVTGAEKSPANLPVINLMGEYINQQVNLGLRLDLQENLMLDFGLLDFDHFKIGLGIKL